MKKKRIAYDAYGNHKPVGWLMHILLLIFRR
jgi:hypothetical protein